MAAFDQLKKIHRRLAPQGSKLVTPKPRRRPETIGRRGMGRLQAIPVSRVRSLDAPAFLGRGFNEIRSLRRHSRATRDSRTDPLLLPLRPRGANVGHPAPVFRADKPPQGPGNETATSRRLRRTARKTKAQRLCTESVAIRTAARPKGFRGSLRRSIAMPPVW